MIPRTFAPASGWSPDGHRIKSEIDYSRGPEKTWVYGGLRVRDGQQITMAASSRNSVFYQQFLQLVEDANPTGEIWIVTDNLSSHNSLSPRTWLEDHPRIRHAFIPVGACTWSTSTVIFIQVTCRVVDGAPSIRVGVASHPSPARICFTRIPSAASGTPSTRRICWYSGASADATAFSPRCGTVEPATTLRDNSPPRAACSPSTSATVSRAPASLTKAPSAATSAACTRSASSRSRATSSRTFFSRASNIPSTEGTATSTDETSRRTAPSLLPTGGVHAHQPRTTRSCSESGSLLSLARAVHNPFAARRHPGASSVSPLRRDACAP
ncbi:hypothetical protein ACWIID_45045 [Streptomyces phaeochromogenes]